MLSDFSSGLEGLNVLSPFDLIVIGPILDSTSMLNNAINFRTPDPLPNHQGLEPSESFARGYDLPLLVLLLSHLIEELKLRFHLDHHHPLLS